MSSLNKDLEDDMAATIRKAMEDLEVKLIRIALRHAQRAYKEGIAMVKNEEPSRRGRPPKLAPAPVVRGRGRPRREETESETESGSD